MESICVTPDPAVAIRRLDATERRGQARVPLYRSGAFWSGVIVTLPIFVTVGGGGVRLAPGYATATRSLLALPVSTICLPVMIAITLLLVRRTRVRIFWEDVLVGLAVFLMTLSALVGLLLAQSPAVGGAANVVIARLGQSLVPLLAYFLARYQIRGVAEPVDTEGGALEDIRALVLGVTLCVLISLAGYLAQTLLGRASDFRFSILADHIGPFYNYKMKRFFPSYLAVASICSLSYYLLAVSTRTRRVLALVASAVAAIALALMWSRTAMLMFAVGILMVVVMSLRSRNRSVRPRLLAISLMVLTTIPIGAAALQQFEVRSFQRILTTVVVVLSGFEDAGQGDVNRFDRMERGFLVGLGQPLGDMYRITEGRNVLESENGYLDFAVRAGPGAMLLVLVVLAVTTLRAVRLAARTLSDPTEDEAGWFVAAYAAVMISIVLIGNFWLNLASEPYFAPFLWFMVGATVALQPVAGAGRARLAAGPGHG